MEVPFRDDQSSLLFLAYLPVVGFCINCCLLQKVERHILLSGHNVSIPRYHN